MGTFFDSVSRGMRAVKWGLVVHTAVVFILVTISGGIYINYQLISYIGERGFPGADGVVPPGPLGYGFLTNYDGIEFVPALLFLLIQSLVDGFLVSPMSCLLGEMLITDCSSALPLLHHLLHEPLGHRLTVSDIPRLYWYVSKPLRATVARFANLIGTGTGVTCVYKKSQSEDGEYTSLLVKQAPVAYDIICLSLNVLLTLMIVARLALHRRETQNVMGASFKASGLYKSIISMLVESCALYAGSFLVYTVTWGTNGSLAATFQPVLGETQVRAVLTCDLGELETNQGRIGHRSVPDHPSGRQPDRGDN